MKWRSVTIERPIRGSRPSFQHGNSPRMNVQRVTGYALESSPGEPVTADDGRVVVLVPNGGNILMTAAVVRNAWSQPEAVSG